MTQPDRFHIAQFNVALQRAPLEAPEFAEFVALLSPINALADAAPGFVWRLAEGEHDDATEIRPYGEMVIVNFSVWTSPELLWDYVYRSAHLDVMRRRREWFHRALEPHHVLWWMPAGEIPTVADAMARLARLRADGPGPDAFTFRDRYPSPEVSAATR